MVYTHKIIKSPGRKILSTYLPGVSTGASEKGGMRKGRRHGEDWKRKGKRGRKWQKNKKN